MSRLAIGLLLVCLHAGSAYGLDCNYGSNKNFFENLLTTCPRLTDPQENSYCCYDFAHDRAYCCNFEEFTMKTGVGIIIPVVIAVAIVVGLVVCCISCLCCSCCPWYRRRQGTVYGRPSAMA